MNRKKKKSYQKPKIVTVRLAIQNPVLGFCEQPSGAEIGDAYCQLSLHCGAG
jgi:hypothetical protein